MRNTFRLLAISIPAALLAQLTPDQRVQDFQYLAGMFAKRYAPYEWKKQAVGFDLYDIGPWLARVRAAKDDLEYHEIRSEYVASLDDRGPYYLVGSSFIADSGLYVDIYDGKVLIESINRTLLPAARYPFQAGDELVSVDGKTAEEWITYFSRLRKRGSPDATRRSNADLITYRPQAYVPRAVELGDTAEMVVRRASGATETYSVPWTKSGCPGGKIRPVPSPKAATRRWAESGDPTPSYLQALLELQDATPPPDNLDLGETWREDTGEAAPRRYTIGINARAPLFRNGLPSSFVQRQGRATADYLFSGVYEAEGFRIGFLRFPSLSPSNITTAIRELETEVQYFQQNADGLVVDLTRVSSGSVCNAADFAARLILGTFHTFGTYIRPTLDYISSIQNSLNAARAANAESWVIQIYEVILGELRQAYSENRGLTGLIPVCAPSGTPLPPLLERPAVATVYTKPLVVLVDTYTDAAGEGLAAMLQDSGRAVVVGSRTTGSTGFSGYWPAGFYSEAYTYVTSQFGARKNTIVTPEYPATNLIENVGMRPDVPLEYMTRDNLLNSGASFVQGFTRVLTDQIRAAH